MPIFIFLHVLVMFAAVALAYGPAALLVVAGRRRDVRALRAITATSERLVPVVGAAGLGIALGFAAVFVHDFNPLLGWLIIAYALVIASLVMTFALATHGSRGSRLQPMSAPTTRCRPSWMRSSMLRSTSRC